METHKIYYLFYSIYYFLRYVESKVIKSLTGEAIVMIH